MALRRAIELDPRDINGYNNLAATYLCLRRFPEALATTDRALSVESANAQALGLKADAFWATGDLGAVESLLANPGTEPLLWGGLTVPARGVQALFHRQYPDSYQAAGAHAGLGVAYTGLGEATSAIAEAQKAMAINPTSKDSFEGLSMEEYMARSYALLGDADHAISILKRLLQTPYGLAITPALLRLGPIWDQIRDDPRFQELAAEKQGGSR